MNTKKLLLFTLTLILIFISIEVSLRVIYFQKNSLSFLAIEKFYPHIKRNLKQRLVDKNFKIDTKGLWQALYTKDNQLISSLKEIYELHFKEMVSLCKSKNIKLFVLYIPLTQPDSNRHMSEEICKTFFKNISLSYDISFLDVTETLRQHPFHHVTLMPEDQHLSRFGNILVSEIVASYILKQFDLNSFSKSKYSDEPITLGGYKVFSGKTYNKMNQKVTINKHGFRAIKDVQIPKNKFRIACVGDSFTFGAGVANTQTYPHFLNLNLKHTEVLNLGKNGTSIITQLIILKKAIQCDPDLVILQVLDNDLYGLMTHVQEDYSFVKPTKRPKVETEFLKRLGKLN